MEQKDKISVIITAYNVEAYADECIKSVLQQTYHNLEIIIIDDGSTDQSGKIFDRWAEKDARIKVIHQQNSGPANARNKALQYVTGDYVGFVDGDDVAFPEMYDELLRYLKKEKAQISCCRAKKDTSFVQTHNYQAEKTSVKTFTSKQAMKSLVLEEEIDVTVWNKLYCRSVIQGVYFEKNKYIDDEFWMYQIIARADKIISLNAELYGYRQRENSLMSRHYSLRHQDILDARVNRLLFLMKNNPELVSDARCNLWFECIRAYQLSILYLTDDDQKMGKKKALCTAKKYPIHYVDYKGLPYGRQVWCVLSRFSFAVTCYIRNWFHYGP